LYSQQQQAQASKGNAPSGKQVKDADDETQLREPIDLPDLPRFTGHAHFDNGKVRQTVSGQGSLQEFTVQESTNTVFDWYKSVLQMNQWKITNNAPDILTATKNKNHCTIGVYRSYDKRWATRLIINYFVGNSSR
jgi:hypothetical protein